MTSTSSPTLRLRGLAPVALMVVVCSLAGRRRATTACAGRTEAFRAGRRGADARSPRRCAVLPFRRCPRCPRPRAAIVPVAASSVGAKPDQWIGEYVAMTGVVDATLGRMAFTVDQDKTKSGPDDILVLAHRMSDSVVPNTYVNVIGLLMKYDPADVAAKSKAHAQDLPADVVAKYKGRPVILATAVVNDKMLDLARFIPPAMTPEEEALSKAMKGVPAASGELRKGADGSNVEMATKNVASLTAAFTEAEAFMKKRGKMDAMKWAADARANVLAVEKAAKGAQWDAAKAAAAAIGGSCATCHTPYRERLEDGCFRFKAGARAEAGF